MFYSCIMSNLLDLLISFASQHYAKVKRITSPEIICCVTAHPAIHKACKYFGVTLIKAPYDPRTFQLTPAIVKRYLTRNTIAIYASAPTFPHGVLDDVEGLASLATKRGIGLHVDNCLGGFLLSYLRKEKVRVCLILLNVANTSDSNAINASSHILCDSICLFAADDPRFRLFRPRRHHNEVRGAIFC